jgi:Cytosine deaminase and related metal-dependent hydrolases
MKTIIKNVHVVTMDDQLNEWKHGYVLIDNEEIVALGDEATLDHSLTVDQVIDGQRGILMPGMINTHTHAGMIPFRSLGDDVPDRLRRFLFPLEQFMTKELVKSSSDYAIAEMLLSGVTSFCDMYYFEDEVAQSCDEMGVRALVGETIIDMPTCDSPTASEALVYTEQFIQKWQDHPLITPVIAPHATNTNTLEIFKDILALGKKYETPITMHVSEMTYELSEFEEKYQQTPIAFLESLGYFDHDLIMAHCILATSEDVELIAAAKENVRVAHCIGANTKSAKGVAPIKEMLANDITVGLGTDGPSSGNTLDLFTQMRMFANFQKTANQDRALFPAKEIVALATIGGAKTLGLDQQVGSLEVGKKADIVLVETDSVNMFPIFDAYSALVYSANPSNVQSVWVNGQQLVANKQLVKQELGQLKAKLYQSMETFVKEAKKRS